MNDEEPEYLVAHIEDALAHDPRVNELGLHVAVRGRRLFVNGTVSTDARRQAVAEVVAELAEGFDVHNETAVATMATPEDGEELS